MELIQVLINWVNYGYWLKPIKN